VADILNKHLCVGDGTWADWGVEQDLNTTKVHETVLDQERPNYVYVPLKPSVAGLTLVGFSMEIFSLVRIRS